VGFGTVVLSALIGCGAAPPAPVAATRPAPEIAWESTRLTVAGGDSVAAETGWLVVPERHGRAVSGTVRLSLLRLRSAAAHPGPPIVYLSGGPGGSGTAAVRGSLLPFFLSLREVADVIAIDQRGAGRSRPALVCRESWSHPLDRVVGKSELQATARARSASCATLLREQGHDLGGYSTVESAEDLELLRRALGVPTLQLLGTSYGTQLALAALRQHPTSFERAVLLSAKGTQHALRLPSTFDRQLTALEQAIARDPAAREAFPELVSPLAAVLRRLEEAPREVEVPLPQSKGTARLRVGPFDLQLMVVQSLASKAETELLPVRLAALSRGDFRPLGQFALGLRRGWLGSAMPYLVECSSGPSDERLARIHREAPGSLVGAAVDFPFPEICAGWEAPPLGSDWREPVRSEVPILVIAATEDVRTPLEDAREILAGLSRGTLVTLDGFGHGDELLATPEVVATVRAFLAGEKVEPRTIPLPPLVFPLHLPPGASER
jgi:pimeloyl-ACP methyl ester carboxylesterase